MHFTFECANVNARVACLLHIAYAPNLVHAGRYDSVNKIRSQRAFGYCGIVAKIWCEQGGSRAGNEWAPLRALIRGQLRVLKYINTHLFV